jgi:hypothetical protein
MSKKLTWSYLCESPSNPMAMSTFYFMDPKNSWPSKWGVLVVKEDPLVYFAMMLVVCNGSPIWLIRHNRNSSLLGPSPHLPPFKYTLYDALCFNMNIIIKSHSQKSSAFFPYCCNQILWMFSNRLQVSMSTSSSKINFFKHLKKKTN